MEEEQEIKYSADGIVSFEDKDHVYRNVKTGKMLTSISGLIKRFSDTDFAAIAQKVADKREVPVKEVLAEWDLACVMGTALHLPFEQYEQTGTYTLPIRYKQSKVVDRCINDLFINGPLQPLGSEIIVHNDNYAGQIDCVAKNAANDLFILDWKSNKSLSDFSMDRKRKKFPFKALNDSKLAGYSMQLSFYREMYEQMTGTKIKECYIIHILKTKYKRIPIIDIDRELIRKVLNNEIVVKDIDDLEEF